MEQRGIHGDPDRMGGDVNDSPCVRNCCLDANDICMGCFRSLHEITTWGELDTEQRNEVLKKTARRRDEQHRQWAQSLGLLDQ